MIGVAVGLGLYAMYKSGRARHSNSLVQKEEGYKLPLAPNAEVTLSHGENVELARGLDAALEFLECYSGDKLLFLEYGQPGDQKSCFDAFLTEQGYWQVEHYGSFYLLILVTRERLKPMLLRLFQRPEQVPIYEFLEDVEKEYWP
jgi:hypothetical protein